MTSSIPTSTKKFIATTSRKIRKIALATLIVAVSLSVAIEIGYTTSLVQGYSIKADSYKLSACTGKVQELSQKRIIRDMDGFSGVVYECTHTKYAGSIYGNVISIT